MFTFLHSYRHAVEIKCINKVFPGYQKMFICMNNIWIVIIQTKVWGVNRPNDPDSQCSPLFGLW